MMLPVEPGMTNTQCWDCNTESTRCKTIINEETLASVMSYILRIHKIKGILILLKCHNFNDQYTKAWKTIRCTRVFPNTVHSHLEPKTHSMIAADPILENWTREAVSWHCQTAFKGALSNLHCG